jgi:hypothetical protein
MASTVNKCSTSATAPITLTASTARTAETDSTASTTSTASIALVNVTAMTVSAVNRDSIAANTTITFTLLDSFTALKRGEVPGCFA